MELSIKTHGLDLSDPLKAYTEGRLRVSLGDFVTQLDGVEVRLGDTTVRAAESTRGVRSK